jgi:hypothetical protein
MVSLPVGHGGFLPVANDGACRVIRIAVLIELELSHAFWYLVFEQLFLVFTFCGQKWACGIGHTMSEPSPKHSSFLLIWPLRITNVSWWLSLKIQTLFVINLTRLCFASIQSIAKSTVRLLLFLSRSKRNPGLVTFQKLLSVWSKKLSDRGLVSIEINRLLLFWLRRFFYYCIIFAK